MVFLGGAVLAHLMRDRDQVCFSFSVCYLVINFRTFGYQKLSGKSKVYIIAFEKWESNKADISFFNLFFTY